MRHLLLLTLLFTLPAGALASPAELLVAAAKAMNDQQPRLQTYRAAVETDQVAAMLARMTANMPANLPRPEVPQLFKYWDRQRQAMLVQAEGGQIFPYMQEMIRRFSSNFALELHGFFLPTARSAERTTLLAVARVQQRQTSGAGGGLTELELAFDPPADLQGAFFRDGLGLPQRDVSRLLLAFDGGQRLRRLDLTTAEGGGWTLSLGYQSAGTLQLPANLQLMGAAGTRETRVETRFAEQDGFWLPVEQRQSLRDGDKHEQRLVQFHDYQVNIPLPAEVLQRMEQP